MVYFWLSFLCFLEKKNYLGGYFEKVMICTFAPLFPICQNLVYIVQTKWSGHYFFCVTGTGSIFVSCRMHWHHFSHTHNIKTLPFRAFICRKQLIKIKDLVLIRLERHKENKFIFIFKQHQCFYIKIQKSPWLDHDSLHFFNHYIPSFQWSSHLEM